MAPHSKFNWKYRLVQPWPSVGPLAPLASSQLQTSMAKSFEVTIAIYSILAEEIHNGGSVEHIHRTNGTSSMAGTFRPLF